MSKRPYNGEDITARANLAADFLKDKYLGLELEPKRCANQATLIGDGGKPVALQHILWKLGVEVPDLVQNRKFKAARKEVDWAVGALWGLSCIQLGQRFER